MSSLHMVVKYRTILLLDTNQPFEYWTSLVFEQSLYYNGCSDHSISGPVMKWFRAVRTKRRSTIQILNQYMNDKRLFRQNGGRLRSRQSCIKIVWNDVRDHASLFENRTCPVFRSPCTAKTFRF